MGQKTTEAVALLVAAQTNVEARLESLTAQIEALKNDPDDQTNADAIKAAVQGIGGAVDKLSAVVNPPAPDEPHGEDVNPPEVQPEG